MKPGGAVGDMSVKLERARDRLPDEGGPYLASIILDGENAWEQYPNNGNDFLRTLYGRLQSDERFETVRVSDFLAANPATVELPRLHTGSWIEASLRVWSGEPAHARAWPRSSARVVSRRSSGARCATCPRACGSRSWSPRAATGSGGTRA